LSDFKLLGDTTQVDILEEGLRHATRGIKNKRGFWYLLAEKMVNGEVKGIAAESIRVPTHPMAIAAKLYEYLKENSGADKKFAPFKELSANEKAIFLNMVKIVIKSLGYR